MKILIILMLLNNLNIFCKDINQLYIDEKLNDTDIVVISFEKMDDCVKCVSASFSFVYELKSKITKKDLKHIVALPCTRDIELMVFKNQYEFTGILMKETKSLKKDLGLDSKTKLAIFKNKKLIIELSYEKLYNFDYSIDNILSESY